MLATLHSGIAVQAVRRTGDPGANAAGRNPAETLACRKPANAPRNPGTVSEPRKAALKLFGVRSFRAVARVALHGKFGFDFSQDRKKLILCG